MQDLVEKISLRLCELLCRGLDAKLLPKVFKNHDVCHALIALEISELELDAHLLHDMLLSLHVHWFCIGNDAVHIVDECFQDNSSIHAFVSCIRACTR